MNRKISSAAVALALVMTISGAHAFGNACKRVNFSVDNNFTFYDPATKSNRTVPITVERFELWSQSEGRWLNENFADVVVPAGAKDYAVRRGETVEYAENDKITQIRVSFKYFADTSLNAPATWHEATRTDTSIADQVCVADRWYKATINP